MSETEYALGTYCGITFAGIKAASLFRLRRSCGDCLEKYVRLFGQRGFAFEILQSGKERILLFVYNRAQLGRLLAQPENRAFLEEMGYSYRTAEEALAQLKGRMEGDGFPHEIGIFLSYPLEDVKGFIAHPNEEVKLVGYWKVYGDEERKKRVFDTYARCTDNIRKKLRGGIPLEEIFRLPSQGDVRRQRR